MSKKARKKTITKKKVVEKPLTIDPDIAKQALGTIVKPTSDAFNEEELNKAADETAKGQEKYDAQFDGTNDPISKKELDKIQESVVVETPHPVTTKIVKQDIIIWQAGKSLEEMWDDQEKIIVILKQALRDLSAKREFFNAGSIYTALKKGGYELEHKDINKLLRKLKIYPSARGQNIYKSRLVAGKVGIKN